MSLTGGPAGPAGPSSPSFPLRPCKMKAVSMRTILKYFPFIPLPIPYIIAKCMRNLLFVPVLLVFLLLQIFLHRPGCPEKKHSLIIQWLDKRCYLLLEGYLKVMSDYIEAFRAWQTHRSWWTSASV